MDSMEMVPTFTRDPSNCHNFSPSRARSLPRILAPLMTSLLFPEPFSRGRWRSVVGDLFGRVNGNTYFRPAWQQQRRPVAARSVTTTIVLLISSLIVLQDD